MGSPGIVEPASGHIVIAPNIAGLDSLDIQAVYISSTNEKHEASVLHAAALYEASEDWLSRWPEL